eukprot:TRINITY_DN2432_c0_g1_i2.p1 TRINITY_DN2432_c0_g1~~TRINITY_DN2432_c0_g1_i2.p1  ORF type:complete len:744 (+),score=227.28 TRINITY_DN2432_c0_g1_i2:1729-3960(+)
MGSFHFIKALIIDDNDLNCTEYLCDLPFRDVILNKDQPNRMNFAKVLIDSCGVKKLNNFLVDQKNTLLQLACVEDDIELVKLMVDKGCKLEEENSDKISSFLCYAMDENRTEFKWEVLEYLIKNELIDLTRTDDNENTGLHLCVKNIKLIVDKFNIFKKILKDESLFEKKNNDGDTPLVCLLKTFQNAKDEEKMIAKKNVILVLKYFFQNNVNVNAKNKENKSAIHYCVHDRDLLKLLRNVGADINQNWDEDATTPLNTPLEAAITLQLNEKQKEKRNYCAIKFLHVYGAKLDPKRNIDTIDDKEMKRTLNYAKEKEEKFSKINFDEFNQKCFYYDIDQQFLLSFVAVNWKLFIFCFRQTVDIDKKNEKGYRPLNYAIQSGHIGIIKYLIYANAIISLDENSPILQCVKDINRRTLMLKILNLIFENNKDKIEFFLNVKDENSCDLIYHVVDDLRLLKFLVKHSEKKKVSFDLGKALFKACEEQHMKSIEYCLSLTEEKNFELSNDSFLKCINFALKNQKKNVLKKFAKTKAKRFIRACSDDHMNILHVAACENNVEKFKLLMELDIPIKYESKGGKNRQFNYLDFASIYDSIDVIELLLQITVKGNGYRIDGVERTLEDEKSVVFCRSGYNICVTNKYFKKLLLNSLKEATKNGSLKAVKTLLEDDDFKVENENEINEIFLNMVKAEKNEIGMIRCLETNISGFENLITVQTIEDAKVHISESKKTDLSQLLLQMFTKTQSV